MIRNSPVVFVSIPELKFTMSSADPHNRLFTYVSKPPPLPDFFLTIIVKR